MHCGMVLRIAALAIQLPSRLLQYSVDQWSPALVTAATTMQTVGRSKERVMQFLLIGMSPPPTPDTLVGFALVLLAFLAFIVHLLHKNFRPSLSPDSLRAISLGTIAGSIIGVLCGRLTMPDDWMDHWTGFLIAGMIVRAFFGGLLGAVAITLILGVAARRRARCQTD